MTSLVKRRQRKLKPCVSLEIMYQLRPSAWVARGQYRHDRYRRGRVGSAGVLEQGKGLGWVAREPVRSRAPMCKWPERGNPADQRAQARMRSLPRRERRCEHEGRGACGARNRKHKGAGLREREVVAPS